MSLKPIKLYSHSRGPNPAKVKILLEELGLPYDAILMEMNDQPGGVKHPDFLKINPNGRVPAIIDPNNNNFVVWESAAILVYLSQKYDKKNEWFPSSIEDQAIVNEWLAYQISGQGPSQGQVNWFTHLDSSTTKNDTAIERYTNETKRIYKTLDGHLANTNGWIALGHPTIADIAWYSWAKIAPFAGIDLSVYKNVSAWKEKVEARPAIQKAYS
jgi:glutathione S-transferase